MDLWWLFFVIDWILFVPIALTVLYLFVFSLAALLRQNVTAVKSKHSNRFIVLIPAYKNDKTVLNTVHSVLGQSYPMRNFDIVVISDHQSEMCNALLAQLPITLLAHNFAKSSKAKSLQYAILNLPQFKIYDIALILDADDIVEPDFLEKMNNAYESAGTKAIQAHLLPKNRDTDIARLDSVFEAINNTIFRCGHVAIGFSSALNKSGVAFDFNWFRENIMNVRATVGENKELEALLNRDGIFVDYFDDIHVYAEKIRRLNDFNLQHGLWLRSQFNTLVSNIRFLPLAIVRHQYSWADKIIQWALIPRIFMMGIIGIASIVFPFIYMTSVIKWWVIGTLCMVAYGLATPDYLVDKNWNRDFLRVPQIVLGSYISVLKISRDKLMGRSRLFHIRRVKKTR